MVLWMIFTQLEPLVAPIQLGASEAGIQGSRRSGEGVYTGLPPSLLLAFLIRLGSVPCVYIGF